MILLLICMLFCSRLYELTSPFLFGRYGDLFIRTRRESENGNYNKSVTDLANIYLYSYLINEAFIASFINLFPILLFAYKTDIILFDWFIVFYITTIIVITTTYAVVNFAKSEKIMHQAYHPNFYRSITIVVIFLAFIKLYVMHI